MTGERMSILEDDELSLIYGGSLDCVAANIRMLRITKGITQKTLSEVIHVDVTMVSAYENGRFLPSYEVLLDISEYFETSLDNILK